MRRKYILISDNFPPCKGGGIAEWAFGIASNMALLGCEVTVLSRWKNKNDRNTHRNQQFRIVHMAGRDWNRYRYWYALYTFSFICRKRQMLLFWQQPGNLLHP